MNVDLLFGYKNYAQVINNKQFGIIIAEKYDYNIPNYFLQTRKSDNPIVNGQEITWEQYYELFPDEMRNMPDKFIPEPIYKAQSENLTWSKATIATIIQFFEDNVEFQLQHLQDTGIIITIMDRYCSSIERYIAVNAQLKQFVDKLKYARAKMFDMYETITASARKKYLATKPKTLEEILQQYK